MRAFAGGEVEDDCNREDHVSAGVVFRTGFGEPRPRDERNGKEEEAEYLEDEVGLRSLEEAGEEIECKRQSKCIWTVAAFGREDET